MNPRRGIIGLFATIFLVSAISMVMLVIDDRNDLSSRASGWLVNNLRPALSEINQAPTETVWDGTVYKIPVSIKYNNTLWIPPRDRNTVFYHTGLPVTIRLTTGPVAIDTLQKILGPNFVKIKLASDSQSEAGWYIQTYNAQFFGDSKTIEVWSGLGDVTLVVVKPSDISNVDVLDFARAIVSSSAEGQVKGLASEQDTIRLAALARPSVVMILNIYCSSVRFTDNPTFVLSGRQYPYCLTTVGSGFFVTDTGHIATNGHVLKNVPETSLFYSVTSGSLDDLLTDYLQVYTAQKTGTLPTRDEMALKVKEAHANKEELYQFSALVRELYQRKYLALGTSENKYYVQLGNTPMQLSKSGVNVGSDILMAKLIDVDYTEPDKVTGFSSSDVAILKVEGKNFPALPLGSTDDLQVGSSLQVIGFPGLVMGSNSFLLDTSANAEPTFTKGVVSAFKLAKGDQKRLIQTDASINHGNSGGPALSSDGFVVGIATYGLTPEEGSGNYNFLRDIQDLKDLLNKNHISPNTGDTYNHWKNGLSNYWLSYFRYAKEDFDKISSLYPIHPSVSKYLTVTKSKINTPEDQTPRFSRSERSMYMAISSVVMTISLIIIITLWAIDISVTRRQTLVANKL